MGILDRIISLMLEKPGEEKRSRQNGEEFPVDAAIGIGFVLVVVVVVCFLAVRILGPIWIWLSEYPNGL